MVNQGHERKKLKSWKNFIDLLRDGRLGQFNVWRGQAERHKNLLPPIYRAPYLKNFGDNELKTLRLFYELSRGIADDVRPLKEISFPDKNDPEYEKHKFFIRPEVFEWWSLARHHGLPTPFLDWSLYPLAALFMAIYGLEKKDTVRGKYKISLWSLSFPLRDSDLDALVHPIWEVIASGEDVDFHQKDGVGLYFFTDAGLYNRRITAQGGLFTYIVPDANRMEIPIQQRYDVLNFVKSQDRAQTLKEYVITFDSSDDIRLCRKYLMRAGITPRTMFPDLKGVVEDCMYRLKNSDFTACPLPMTSHDFTRMGVEFMKSRRNSRS